MNTATHRATLNNETIDFDADDYDTTIPALVARHGGGVPEIVKLDDVMTAKSVDAPAPKSSPIAAGEMNDVGRIRSEEDLAAAVARGWTPKATVYARGSQVNETGVENAARSRHAWEKRPLIRDAAAEFSEVIAREQRGARVEKTGSIRMTRSGRLQLADRAGSPIQMGLTEHAFRGMVERMGLPRAAGFDRTRTITRAGVVNAFTHYAHTGLDAFDGFEVERAASKLLAPGSRLPFVPLQA
jgi:hypothetical protein